MSAALDTLQKQIPLEIANHAHSVQKDKWEQAQDPSTIASINKEVRILGDSCERSVLSTVHRQLNKLTHIWWLRVTTPVEIKPARTAPTDVKNDWIVGSAELVRYMKQILKTQLDRRFVFGVLICGHSLRIFYDDRTGLVATEDAIDIPEVHWAHHLAIPF